MMSAPQAELCHITPIFLLRILERPEACTGVHSTWYFVVLPFTAVGFLRDGVSASDSHLVVTWS